MKKISLKTVKNLLSREEMKTITGGYETPGGGGGCETLGLCALWCPSQGGFCEYYYGCYKCRVG